MLSAGTGSLRRTAMPRRVGIWGVSGERGGTLGVVTTVRDVGREQVGAEELYTEAAEALVPVGPASPILVEERGPVWGLTRRADMRQETRTQKC